MILLALIIFRPDLGSAASSRAPMAGAVGITASHRRQPTPATNPTWHHAKASFYDYHPSSRRRTADGTRYRSDGQWVATRLVPMGAVIEIRRGNVVIRVQRRDTPAKRYGGRLDLPAKTWDMFKAPRSRGLLNVEWRRVK